MEDAVIIMNANGDADGVGAEYYYLEKKFGKNGVDWSLISQSLIADEAGRYYDQTGYSPLHWKDDHNVL